MPVTVDREPLAVEKLGLQTVGQVLAHVQQKDRMVVQLLIDGEEPEQISQAKLTPLNGRTIYIETADPRRLALDVIDEVGQQLAQANVLKDESADLLQRNQPNKAMEKLRACFTSWQNAHESVIKIAQLLRIDLQALCVDDQPMSQMLASFADQLRQIRSALEQRDFVLLADILLYETSQTTALWNLALDAMRDLIESL